ncbi:hypothetical protein VTG60DRAFT_3253 [Thermothelomyces hinnuleus]
MRDAVEKWLANLLAEYAEGTPDTRWDGKHMALYTVMRFTNGADEAHGLRVTVYGASTEGLRLLGQVRSEAKTTAALQDLKQLLAYLLPPPQLPEPP